MQQHLSDRPFFSLKISTRVICMHTHTVCLLSVSFARPIQRARLLSSLLAANLMSKLPSSPKRRIRSWLIWYPDTGALTLRAFTHGFATRGDLVRPREFSFGCLRTEQRHGKGCQGRHIQGDSGMADQIFIMKIMRMRLIEKNAVE